MLNISFYIIIIIVITIIITSADMLPREFKNYDNTKLGTGHQSV